MTHTKLPAKFFILMAAAIFMSIVLAAINNDAVAQTAPKPALYIELQGVADPAHIPAGQEFTARIMMSNAQEVFGVHFDIRYDTSELTALDGNPSMAGVNAVLEHDFDTVLENRGESGMFVFTAMCMNRAPISGTGAVASIRFKKLTAGAARLHFMDSPQYRPAQASHIIDGVSFITNPAMVDMDVSTAGDKAAPDVDIIEAQPFTVSPHNSPGVLDTTTLSFTLSENATVWADLRTPDNTTVYTWYTGAAISGGGANSLKQITLGTQLPSASGKYKLHIKAVDAAGNVAEIEKVVINIDNTNPGRGTLTYSPRYFSPNGDGNSESVSFKLTPSEPVSGAITILNYLGQAVMQLPFTYETGAVELAWNGEDQDGKLLPGGAYTFRINLTDNAGNAYVETITSPITLDIKPPSFSAQSPAETVGGSSRISVRAADAGGAGLTPSSRLMSIDGGNFFIPDYNQQNGELFFVSTSFAEGAHAVSAVILDNAGNQTQTAWEFTVDKTPPVIYGLKAEPAVFGPLSQAPNNIAHIKFYSLEPVCYSAGIFTHTSAGPGALAFEPVSVSAPVCVQAGDIEFTWNGRWKNGSMQSGAYDVKVTVSDNAGNKASAITQVDVDTTPPKITAALDRPYFSPNGDGTADAMDFTYTNNETASVKIDVFRAEGTPVLVKTIVNSTTPAPAGTHVESWDGTDSGGNLITQGGLYKFVISAIDASGNSGTSELFFMADFTGPNFVSWTPTDAPGTRRPSIAVEVSDTGSNIDTGSFKLTLTDAETGIQEVHTQGFVWSANKTTYTLASDLSGSSYSAQAEVRDNAGNLSIKSWQFALDTTPPEVKILNPPQNLITSENFALVIQAEDKGLGLKQVEVAGAPAATVYDPQTVQMPISHQVDISAYPEEGDETIHITARDNATVPNAKAIDYHFTIDRTAPVISEPAVSNVYFSPAGNSLLKTTKFTAKVEERNGFTATLAVACGGEPACVSKYGTEPFLAHSETFNPLAPGEKALVSFTWDGRDNAGAIPGDGVYRAIWVIKDTTGHQVMSEPAMQVWLDSTPPELSVITSPLADAVLGDVPLQATAQDAGAGIESVTFRDSSMTQIVSGNYEYTWHTGDDGGDDGRQELAIVAVDRAGNTAKSATVSVWVAKTAVNVSALKAEPEAFAPHNSLGNSANTQTSITFQLITAVPVFSATYQVDMSSCDTVHGAWSGKTFSKTYTPSSGPGFVNEFIQIIWDGDNDAGDGYAPEGICTARVTATAQGSGGYLPPVTKNIAILIDETMPVVTASSAPADYFSPDNFGGRNQIILTASVNEANAFTGKLTICSMSATPCAEGSTVALEEYSQGRPSSPGDRTIDYSWDGRDRLAGVTVPDGVYFYTFEIRDEAGNITIAAGSLEKNNPPEITLEPVNPFSPNEDNINDQAVIRFNTNEEGWFSATIYNSQGQSIETLSPVEMHVSSGVAQFVWDGLDDSDNPYPEGVYTVKITGYGLPASPERNESRPISGQVILDVSSPELSNYFPTENEYIGPGGKIKIAAREFPEQNGSGLDENALMITIDGAPQSLSGMELDPDGGLAGGYLPDNLSYGPHQMEAWLSDRAGNQSHLTSMRFVIQPNFSEDFEDPSREGQFWRANKVQTDSTAAYTVIDGKLKVEDTNENNIHAVQGPQFVGSGVVINHPQYYEVDRREAVFTMRAAVSGEDYYGAILSVRQYNSENGVSIMAGGGFAGFGSQGVCVNVGVSQTNTYCYTREQIAEKLGIPDFDIFQMHEYSIKYEDGITTYYVDSALIHKGEQKISFDFVGMSTFAGDTIISGTTSSLHAQIDAVKTNLPWVHFDKPKFYVEGDPERIDLVPGEDRYVIEASGTPWMIPQVNGVIFNINRANIHRDMDSSIDDSFIPPMATLVENPSGSGNYKFTNRIETIPLDAAGNEAPVLFAGVDPVKFHYTSWLWGGHETYSTSFLRIKTGAVQNVELDSADYPGTGYINTGERYTIAAQTKPGDWRVTAYIVNISKLSYLLNSGMDIRAGIEKAKVEGPLTLLKTAEGAYGLTKYLQSSLDRDGEQADMLLALVSYGALDSEYSIGIQPLTVGTPAVRIAKIENTNRTEENVLKNETLKVTVIGLEGQTLQASLVNAQSQSKAPISTPFTLNASPDNPRLYAGYIVFKNTKDQYLGEARNLQAAVAYTMPSSPGATAFSYTNTLNILAGDNEAPAPPQELTAMPKDGQVSLTWRQNNESDLTGYRPYLIQNVSERSISVAAGYPPLECNATPNGYNISNSVMNLDGIDYKDFPDGPSGAIWMDLDSESKIYSLPLPQQNENAVDGAKDIFVYLLHAVENNSATLSDRHYTIYSQQGLEKMQWFVDYLVEWGQALPGARIEAYAKACASQNGSEFIVAGQPMPTLLNKLYLPISEGIVSTPSYTKTALTNGIDYKFAVKAEDTSGNFSADSNIADAIPQIPDTTPPAIANLQLGSQWFSPNNDGKADSLNISFDLSEAGTVYLQIYNEYGVKIVTLLDGIQRPAGHNQETWNGSDELGAFLPEGKYVLRIRAADQAGNESQSSEAVFGIDLTSPMVEALLPQAKSLTNNSRPNISAQFSDAASGADISSVAVFLDSSNIINNCALTPAAITCIPAAPLQEKEYSARIVIDDNAGNQTSLEWTFGVNSDVQPPHVTITKPQQGETITTAKPIFSGIITDDISGVDSKTISIDISGLPLDVVFTETTGEFTASSLLPLMEGRYILKAQAADKTGNQLAVPAEIGFIIGIKPLPPSNIVATAGNGIAGLAWVAPVNNEDGSPLSDLAGYNIYVFDGAIYTRINDQPVSLSAAAYTSESLANGQAYNFAVTALDSKGNESAYSELATVTPDGSPPTTTAAGIPGGWANHDITVTFSAVDDNSGVNATYYCLNESSNEPCNPFTGVSGAAVTIGDDGEWNIYYASTDKAGNSEAINRGVLRIDKIPPAQPAIKTLEGQDGTGGIVYVSGRSTEICGIAEPTASIEIFLKTNNPQQSDSVANGTVSATGSFCVAASGLGAQGSKTIFAIATDIAGNKSPNSPDVNFYLQSIVVSNADRLDADNIMVGEHVHVMAWSDPGQSLEGYLINPENMSAPDNGYLISNKFYLTDDGDGTYSANALLAANVDASGSMVDKLSVVIAPADLPGEALFATHALNLQLRTMVSGEPFPKLITQYQEPFFNYRISNISSAVLSGTITGVIVDDGHREVAPVYASFTATISGLQPDLSVNLSSRFTPVDATAGRHKIIIYFQPSGEAGYKETSLLSEIRVEICE